MLIVVANPHDGSGKSTCAVNLACELADFNTHLTDRWRGKYSVVLADADVEGTATRCCSGGHLPVSGDQGPTEDPKDIGRWIQRMQLVREEADYVVVDGPSNFGPALTRIVRICDLVIVPCSVADSVKLLPMIDLIKEARSARSDGGPKSLFVPMYADVGIVAEKELATALLKFGEPVGPVIHESADFPNAFYKGQWIGKFAPDSAAYRDIKALTTSVQEILTLTAKPKDQTGR
jgi:cellulose biosynthesis protein BcsQ